jgi:hypothetical protein
MFGVFSALGAEFFDIQFFPAGLAPQGVIQISVLFARQKHHFRLFFAFGHFKLAIITKLPGLPYFSSGI